MTVEHQQRLGRANGRARLHPDDVTEIRAALARGVARSSLARRYRVSKSTIQSIAERRAWGWLP